MLSTRVDEEFDSFFASKKAKPAKPVDDIDLEKLLDFFRNIAQNKASNLFDYRIKLRSLTDKAGEEIFDPLFEMFDKHIFIPDSLEDLRIEKGEYCFDGNIKGRIFSEAFAYSALKGLIGDNDHKLSSLFLENQYSQFVGYYGVFVNAIKENEKLETGIKLARIKLEELNHNIDQCTFAIELANYDLEHIDSNDLKAEKRRNSRTLRLNKKSDELRELVRKQLQQERKLKQLQSKTIDNYLEADDIHELNVNLRKFLNDNGVTRFELCEIPSVNYCIKQPKQEEKRSFYENPLVQSVAKNNFRFRIAALSIVVVGLLAWHYLGKETPKPKKSNFPAPIHVSEQIPFNTAIESKGLRITSIEPTTNTLDKLAEKAYNRGRYDLAEKHLHRALDREPENPNYLLRMGKVQLKLRKYNKAESYFRKAVPLTREQDQWKINKFIGDSLFKDGRYQESIDLFLKLREEVPTDGEIDQMIAQGYYMLRQYKKTLDYFKSALDKDLSKNKRSEVNKNVKIMQRYLKKI